MDDHSPLIPRKTPPKERAGEKAIWVLYLFFFVFWAVGYSLGLKGNMTLVMGLPLWFVISCIWAFIGVFLALLYVSRRFFT